MGVHDSSIDFRQYEVIKSSASSAQSAEMPTLANWIREAIDAHHKANPDMDRDTYLLSIPPTLEVKYYRAMKAYGCHYRVLEEPNTTAYTTYDSGLIAVAEQEVEGNSARRIEMGYVGELEAIYELNYGGTTEPVILMKGRWVQPRWTGRGCTMI